jgi:hypothetical protein
VSALAVSGTNLFAGTNGGGVFRSSNNGTSWAAVNTDMTNISIAALSVNDTNAIAGTSGGVFRSINNGTNWTIANAGLTNKYVSTFTLSGSVVFAGTSDGSVFLSTNNGTSWDPASISLTASPIVALAVRPVGGGPGANIFAGAIGAGVFRSANNGSTWAPVNAGLTNLSVYALVVSGSNIFAGTNGGGVFLSTNVGTSWTAVNTGLTNTSVMTLAVSGSYLFAGTNGGAFVSTDNGTSWTAANSGLTNAPPVWSFAVTPASGGSGTNVFAGTIGGGVFQSTNNGTSWSAVNPGLTNKNAQVLAANGTYLFAGTRDGVYVRPLSQMTSAATYTITVSSNPSIGGTTSGGGTYTSGSSVTARATPNTGYTFTNWTESGTIVSTNSNYTFTISGNRALVGNFAAIPPAQYTVTLSSNPGNAGTTGGAGTFNSGSSVSVTATPNSGYTFANWTESGTVVSTNSTYQFTITGNRTLIANFLIVSSIEQSGGLPATFAASQNYPNPFNPSTTIGYDLPKSAYVSLKIYNSLGQIVASLVDGHQGAGSYQVRWDALDVPSGVYFYRLQTSQADGQPDFGLAGRQAGNASTGSAQGFVETRKMILLR